MVSKGEALRAVGTLYEYGESHPPAWIAREAQVSKQVIHKIANAFDWPLEVNSRISAERYDQLEQAVREDWSLSEIRRTYGIEYETVKRWFPEAGWEMGGQTGDKNWVRLEENLNRVIKAKYA